MFSLCSLPIIKIKTTIPKKIIAAKQQLALYKKAYWVGAQQDRHHWTVFGELRKYVEAADQNHPSVEIATAGTNDTSNEKI